MGLFNWFKKIIKSILNFGKSYVYCLIRIKREYRERVVVFDTETTGLDFRTILSIGAVGIVAEHN
jgi:DNA polymerase III epsilon subunit-like protein